RIGMFERAERGRIAGKDAQDTAYRVRAFSSHSSLRASNPDRSIIQTKPGPKIAQDCGSRLTHPVKGWLQGNRRQHFKSQAIIARAKSDGRSPLTATRKSAFTSPARKSQSSNSGARLSPNRSRT